MNPTQNNHWYVLASDGRATLCKDREDAEQGAADAREVWPNMGPYQVVLLMDAADHDQAMIAYQATVDNLERRVASLGCQAVQEDSCAS